MARHRCAWLRWNRSSFLLIYGQPAAARIRSIAWRALPIDLSNSPSQQPTGILQVHR
jgi:hypothetical protein